eukprot:gnl/TRDRNA2_/TRDRNA2_181479_c0_seq1.p2 gnl/TRDRNA2_/TRDRNA2_181479_c0~~gnl/TRDRNA2_/TRDRNA2_181479_c0_seq1.p2  ORF type:complete len:131 (+),score=19.73 gnl/TRDRNA2_/TRDRNA2_181479_c0_seq1:117-509(+)
MAPTPPTTTLLPITLPETSPHVWCVDCRTPAGRATCSEWSPSAKKSTKVQSRAVEESPTVAYLRAMDKPTKKNPFQMVGFEDATDKRHAEAQRKEASAPLGIPIIWLVAAVAIEVVGVGIGAYVGHMSMR